MRKFAGAVCMLVAVAMLAAAGWMIYRNHAEESMAGDSAEQALYALLAEMQAESLTAEPVPQQTTEPLRMEIELPEMPVMEIDGQLERTDVQEMIGAPSDLPLFTCTYGDG